MAFLCGVASPSLAQGTDPNVSEIAAQAALSALSVAATPNETLSSFSFLKASGDTSNFRSTQLRGGMNPFQNGLHVEGLFAFQMYNPTLIFPEISPGDKLDVTWASVAATLGVGWEFPLANDWKLRPAGHFSLGHITADATLVGFPLLPSGSEAADSVDGNLNSVGVGASLAVFREVPIGAWQAEYRIRHTFLEFYPINEPQAGNATASSNQTTLFSRHRYPLQNVEIFNLSSKLVLDAGLVLYHGDSATVLGTDWAATAGVGLEMETAGLVSRTVSSGRIMLNGVVTDEFNGLSLGFGLGF